MATTVTPAATAPSQDPAPPSLATAPLPAVTTPQVPTDTRSADNQPQIGKSGPKRNERFSKPQKSAPATSGLAPLLLLVANRPFHDVTRSAVSTWIPSTIMLYAVLHRMDLLMARTYRFFQSAPNWSPTMSQYYLSVCIVYHILNAISAAGMLTDDLVDLLEILEARVKPTDLIIPGPLVPFFNSICTFFCPDTEYGIIHPTLPALTTMSEAGHFLFGNGIDFIFPNSLTLLDQLQRMSSVTVANVTTYPHRRDIYAHICNIPAAVAANNVAAYFGPQTNNNIVIRASDYDTIRETLEDLRLPTAAFNATGASAVPLTWSRILGLTDHDGSALSTFSQTAGVMARYSQFFKSSQTLASLSESGIAAGAVIVSHNVNAHLFAAATIVPGAQGPPVTLAHYTKPAVSDYPIGATHAFEDLDELAEQHGLFTAVNVSFTGRTHAHAGVTLPTDAHLRAGPFWQRISVRRVRNVDILGSVDANLYAHYSYDARKVD